MYEDTEFTNCPEIPQILSIPLRRESYPVLEAEEIFKMPTWNCFFCRDTGWAQYHLAARAIQNYNPNRDANPICQRCGLGGRWMHLKENIDLRLPKDTCEKLDKWDRKNWEETNADRFKKFQQCNDTGVNQASDAARKIASTWNGRRQNRTPEEESYAQYKHQLASNDRYELEDTVNDE